MKKIFAILLVLAMVLSFAACGSTETAADASASTGSDTAAASTGSELAGTYDITVWVADAAVELTKQQIETFNSTNEYGITFNATIESVSEADAATNMITDVEAGGDIYCFAQDQFARLVQAGALAKLGQAATATVTEANDPSVVAAATAGDTLYAYPLTSDNGYFMYYDKSVIPESDVDSLEAIIADCEAAGKNFSMETSTSAWYIASFFFGTGCVSEWETDADGKFISVNDTFDSANGLIAAKGLYKLESTPIHVSSSQGSDFSSGSAVVVTGTWDYETVKAILGDNMGVTDLPSFTVDGTEYHMGSFNGCKLMGVKPQTDAVRQAALHLLAQYLTNEECQMQRFEALSWGPANSVDQASEAVQSNPGLAALLAQSPYSVAQGQIHGSWWDIAKVIGTDVKDSDGSDAGLQAALDHYYESISGLFTMSDSEKNAMTVIGAIGGTNWDTDFAMTDDGSGVWTSDDSFECVGGEEFKVRQGKSWDYSVGNGGDNYVVEEAGTYYVVFDANTETVSLKAAN